MGSNNRLGLCGGQESKESKVCEDAKQEAYLECLTPRQEINNQMKH